MQNWYSMAFIQKKQKKRRMARFIRKLSHSNWNTTQKPILEKTNVMDIPERTKTRNIHIIQQIVELKTLISQ